MDQPVFHRRFETIQVLRAVAAMLVVLVHAVPKHPEGRAGTLSGISDTEALVNFGAIGVDIFFVLSGFVMAATVVRSTGMDAKQFMQDRFRRVVPFYWLASVAFLALLGATGEAVFTEAIANSLTVFPVFFPTEFKYPVLFVGWSLAYELAFYLVVSLMLSLRIPQRALLPSLLGTTLLLAVLGAALSPTAYLAAIWLSPLWFEFAFGIAIFMMWQSRGLRQTALPGWLALGGAVAGFAHALLVVPASAIWLPEDIVAHSTGMLRVLSWGVPSAGLILAMLWLGEPLVQAGRLGKSRLWRILLAIGDASYALYLVHPFVTQFGIPAVSRGAVLLIIGEIGLCCALAMIAHRRVERPLLSAIRRPRAGAAVAPLLPRSI